MMFLEISKDEKFEMLREAWRSLPWSGTSEQIVLRWELLYLMRRDEKRRKRALARSRMR